MPYFNYDGDIEVSIDDFLSACDDSDINDIVDALVEDGYIKPSQIIHEPSMSAPEQLFEEALDKLHGKWNQLSKSEEEILMTLAKRF
jgi:hypothetical protein